MSSEEATSNEVKCTFCHASPPDSVMKKCGNCRSASYCCADHQKKHWKHHKPTCQFIKNGLTSEAVEKKLKVVICGGGSTGCCIAYYLSLVGIKPLIIERGEVACASSGLAGGFLAQNWCDTAKRKDLMRTSWNLHQELAITLNGEEKYDFRGMDTIGLVRPEVGAKLTKQKKNRLNTFEGTEFKWTPWVTTDFYTASNMGNPNTTAQVHPKKFVQEMHKAATERGTETMKGIVEDVLVEEKKGGLSKVVGVIVDGVKIDADIVIVALGPWSGQARKWFGRDVPHVYGQKCHSITMRPKNPRNISNTAVFVDFDGSQYEPKTNVHPTYEFYPRTHGDPSEIYMHGMDEKWIVPAEDDPLTIKPTPGSTERLEMIAGEISDELKGAELLKRQACYMPVALDGEPLLGPIGNFEGAFMASGTAEWGITFGPGAGKVLAELITGQKCCFDITPFSLARLPVDMTVEARDAILAKQKRPNIMQGGA